MFRSWLSKFKWESIDQEHGWWSFVKWAKDRKLPAKARPIDLYFIQKDHDSDVYWRELLGDQVKRLEDQIRIVQQENRGLREKLNSLMSNAPSRSYSEG